MCELGHTSMNGVLAMLDQLRGRLPAGDPDGGRRPPRGSYHAKVTAPCIEACPERLDIPRYIENIKAGRYTESLSVIHEKNPLASVCGRVCVRFCEFACRRGKLDDPINIKHLKRFVSDVEHGRGGEEGGARGDHRAGRQARGGHRRRAGGGHRGLSPAAQGLRGRDLRGAGRAGRHGRGRHPRLSSAARGAAQRGRDHPGRWARRSTTSSAWAATSPLQSLQDEDSLPIFVAIGAQRHRSLRVPGEELKPGRLLSRHRFPAPRQPERTHRGRQGGRGGRRRQRRDGLRPLVAAAGRARRSTWSTAARAPRCPPTRSRFTTPRRRASCTTSSATPPASSSRTASVTGVECIRMELGEPDASGRRSPAPRARLRVRHPVRHGDPGHRPEGRYGLPGQGRRAGREQVGHARRRRRHAGHRPARHLCRRRLRLRPGHADRGDGGRLPGQPLDRPVLPRGPREPDRGRAHEPRLSGPCRRWTKTTSTAWAAPIASTCPCAPCPSASQDFDEVESGLSPEDALLEADRCLRCYRIFLVATEK